MSYLELTRPDENNENSEDEMEKQKTAREERIEKNKQWRMRKNGNSKKYYFEKYFFVVYFLTFRGLKYDKATGKLVVDKEKRDGKFKQMLTCTNCR